MPRELGTSSRRKKGSSASSETTLSDKLTNEELLRQLKALEEDLTVAEQATDASGYNTKAAFLASPFILKHKDKDVKLHAACCLVDILRVYAPEAPFDKDQMWDVFSLIISQLRGLQHGPKGSNYKKHFYILESLALVRTFNICAELDFQDLILQLFKLLFSVLNEKHTVKEQTFMVEIMSPIFEESESISQELLDTVLINIIEPDKKINPAAYKVACNLIERTSTNIEPFIQMFFNSVLTLGKTSESDLAGNVYELILELNRISSSVLLSVLPQLEFKLKSTDVEERLAVTKLLAQMFSDPDSELAAQNKPLWNCYLGRYHDINVDVRIECVKNAKHFLLHHPELSADITEKLCSRSRDPDEKVRQEVVTVVCEAAAENITSISDTLFDEACERMRDKKWHVRREALMCLGKLYKRCITGPTADPQVARKLCWLPSKLLHGYYQNMVEDRLCVERVLSGCLVPVTLKTQERMKRFLSLYTQLDEPAIGAFNVLLKCQSNVRADLYALLGLFEEDKTEELDALMMSHVITLARALPDPFKSQENLKKLQSMLKEVRMRELFKISVSADAGCPAVFKAVSDIVVKLGARNPILETIKALLDRASPVMVDAAGVKVLLDMIKHTLEGQVDDEEWTEDIDASSQIGTKGLELLVTLSGIFPSHFRTTECYENILVFLKHTDHGIVNHALHILSNVADGMEVANKDIAIYYQPVLTKLACKGTPTQAKYAMKSIAKIFKDTTLVFERIFSSVVENLEYDYPLLLSNLTTLAQLAVLAPSIFETKQKAIIRDFVVKELLVKDKSTVEESDSQGDDEWCDYCDVTRETQAKIKGIKLMIRWLQGLQSNHKNSALPVLRLLSTLLANGGDLQNNGCVCSHDCSRLRLAAACGILKVAQEIHYEEAISLEHFQQLALIMQDFCSEVKNIFTKKLHKALDSLKLPLEYLGIFALAANETDKDRKSKVRQMISKNVAIRRDYLKQHTAAQACSHSLLPEYALPSVIHLLAHHPDFKPKEHNSLVQFKEYLSYFMEPILSSKTENCGLLKKLVETIKQTKDAQNPDDPDTNEAMYTICDLAYGLIINKASGLVTEEFPGQPLLPKKMFLLAKLDVPNTKSYLPPGFVFFPGKKKLTSSEPTKLSTLNNKGKKTTKKTREKNTPKTFKEMVDNMDETGDDISDESGLNTTTTRKRPRITRNKRGSKIMNKKETDESSDEMSGVGDITPPASKKNKLSEIKTKKPREAKGRISRSRQTNKTQRAPERESSPELSESKPVKSPLKRATASRTSPRKTPTKPSTSPTKPSTSPIKPSTSPIKPSTSPTKPSTSPTKPSTSPQKSRSKLSRRKSPSPNKPFKPDSSAKPKKSRKVSKRLRSELDASPDDDNDSEPSTLPVASRKMQQKSIVNGLSSPRKKTSSVRKQSPSKRQNTANRSKSPRASPVKRKPTMNTKAAYSTPPTKRQKTPSPSKRPQSTLKVKRRSTRTR